jgi:glycine oxidase
MAMATADVTVMGGGIFGLAIAWECARRGARVHVIEADRIGAGASGGILGALTPHVPENWNAKKEFQLESLLMAESFWAEVQETSGNDPGYARLGRIQPLADEAAVAQAKKRVDGSRLHWRGLAKWRVETATGSDWLGASPSGFWLFDSLSARLHPRRALMALATAICARSGKIDELNLPNAGAAQRSYRAGISLNGNYPNGPVIWATGTGGLADLSVALGRETGAGIKGQAALFACDAPGRAQLFAEALHIVPHGDGTIAVGSTSERDYVNATSTDARLESLVAKARALCPALREAPVIERWAGLRPRAKSRAPMLGRWPDRPGHFIANGGFKIGFGMAPKVAQVMADLVLEGKHGIPEGFGVEDSF